MSSRALLPRETPREMASWTPWTWNQVNWSMVTLKGVPSGRRMVTGWVKGSEGGVKVGMLLGEEDGDDIFSEVWVLQREECVL